MYLYAVCIPLSQHPTARKIASTEYTRAGASIGYSGRDRRRVQLESLDVATEFWNTPELTVIRQD